MKAKQVKLISIWITIVFLTGCATDFNKENTGTLIGGATGALLGSQIGKGSGRLVAVGLGTLAGAYTGNSIGKYMDRQDQIIASQTIQQSLEYSPDYKFGKWNNPNNKHSGKILITKTKEMPNQNLVCRDFVHTIYIDGQEENITGRACRDLRDTKGQWHMANQ